MTLKSDAKFEEKLTCGLENDMNNLANFNKSTLIVKIAKKSTEELCLMALKILKEN